MTDEWITRFIYVVPCELGVPDFIPEFAGVWHVVPDGNWGHHIRVVKAPRRMGKERVPEAIKQKWLQHLYCRFWHQKLYTRHRELPAIETEAA